MPSTITWDNSYAQLEGDAVVKAAAREYLTFKVEGAQFTRAFKAKRWDGSKTLYHVTQNTFPSGLVGEVAAELRRQGHDVTVTDSRTVPGKGMRVVATRIRAYELMPHQQEAVTRIMQATRGVVQHPVGAGKSLVIVGAAAEIDLPTLVLVQRKELLKQQYDQFVKFLPLDSIGMVGDSIWQDGRITVATIQTIAGRLRKIETLAETMEWLKQWQAVFIDECHHLPADSYAMLLRALPNAYYRVGLSATPHRSGKREQELLVTGLTGPVISAYEPTEGIEMGRLVGADVFLVDPGGYPRIVGGKRYTYREEVRDGIIENDRRNALVVKLAERFGEMGATLVLTERLAHGAALRQALLDDGHKEV